MKKVEVRMPEIGDMRLMRETVRTLGGVEETHTYEVSPEPKNGAYFEVFQTPEGDPISPENALDGLLGSSATLETPFEEAHAIVHEFFHRSRLFAPERARYQRVLDAWSWVEARRMESETLKILGFEDGDDVFLPPGGDRFFMTAQEVARVFRVDEETVRRWSGSRLPAALRIGKRYLWRSDAILTIVKNAGPRRPPQRATSTK